MTIQICSDLHLEYHENREWLREHPLLPQADNLIIAGDTYYLNKDFSELEFIQKVSKQFKQVYLIPGNHEYYGGFDVKQAMEPFEVNILPNVTLLNNKSVLLDDTRLIFSTMWSVVQKQIYEVMHGMNDFHKIQFDGVTMNVLHFNRLHLKSWEFLSKEMDIPGKKVVVTHHLPSKQCNLPEFQGNLLNEAFCVDKTDAIEASSVDYWIYGHSHGNQRDFKINNTTLVTNQFGYVSWEEHHDFCYNKILTI